MNRALRDRIAVLARQGFDIAGIRYGKHGKLDIVAPGGRVMTLIVAVTPSDRRAGRNFRTQLRRHARSEPTMPKKDGAAEVGP
jgi:hypothetical protein